MNLYLIILSGILFTGDSSSVSVTKHVYESVKNSAIEKGIPEEYLKQVFSDEKIKVHKEIPERFAKPQEKKNWKEYKKLFVTKQRIDKGVIFYTENEQNLNKVSEKFDMDPYLILSIVGIESNYGNHHKGYTVFNSLYTQIALMPKRTHWAAGEMVELLVYCYSDSIPPHSIFGSYAGAFGYGQFIPSSFNRFAVDFNEDGKRQPYEWPDVIASIANYLVKNGYPGKKIQGSERKEKIYKAVFAYNHSDNYVKAVLELRDELAKAVESKVKNHR